MRRGRGARKRALAQKGWIVRETRSLQVMLALDSEPTQRLHGVVHALRSVLRLVLDAIKAPARPAPAIRAERQPAHVV